MMVTVDTSKLSRHALLEMTLEHVIGLEPRMTAVEDAVATATAALNQLKADIASEIQQVVDGLANAGDVATAVDALNAITTDLTGQSTLLQADDSTTP